ncbi:hypothetical protein G8770_11920 [Aestuariicella hydrocarbonica]|uniref:DUF4148 domain-containing protein n=1 Tax=Pseudomaricurvus hydrocarbonicus TaxID=1470433 RepID=A0A9E5JX87_9GAMM|nr:hypothetical protein [Aestuariicella hydrocarbonica]NHO66251.1 hypothetical protein [Aestuariicella hydrocarbonica]
MKKTYIQASLGIAAVALLTGSLAVALVQAGSSAGPYKMASTNLTDPSSMSHAERATYIHQQMAAANIKFP